MKIGIVLSLVVFALCFSGGNAFSQDTNRYVFLCFGQSNMEGFRGIERQDEGPVDPRFEVLAAVEFFWKNRTPGHWYPAVPPLCRPTTGLSPADYFGRTLVSNLPPAVRVGVVNVAIAGCRIELFDRDQFRPYAAEAPRSMARIIAAYGGNPYRHLVRMAQRAQQDGVIRGILLHQGESNLGDPEWPTKVKRIYEQLLGDLNLRAADVPLLVGEVVGADQQGLCAAMNGIIAELPKAVPTAHVISSRGCEALPDRLHFAPSGYRELGRRYAGKMLELLPVSPAVPRRGP